MPLMQECPECWDTRDDCGVCLGDGYIMTGHGRQAYEIARIATADAAAGRDRATRNIDHSSPRHTCERCQPAHQASA